MKCQSVISHLLFHQLSRDDEMVNSASDTTGLCTEIIGSFFAFLRATFRALGEQECAIVAGCRTEEAQGS